MADAFNKFLVGASPEAVRFRQVFGKDYLIQLPQAWDRIAAIRNQFVHHNKLLEQKQISELRATAKEFVDKISDMVGKLQDAHIYPLIAIIRETRTDYFGRRSAVCICDDNRDYILYTDLDLAPGQQYFLHHQGSSLCIIDPIIIPYPEINTGARS
jgi:hypothetical protein